jgi:hypothetical protein
MAFLKYQPLCSSWMANVNEADTLEAISSGILLTACRLLVSPFIQMAAFGLRVYHALIVLNLSWINNMGVSGFALFLFAFIMSHDQMCDFASKSWNRDISI